MKIALVTGGNLESTDENLHLQRLKVGLLVFSFASRFCTSAADMKIRMFTSDLQDKNEYKVCLTSIISKCIAYFKTFLAFLNWIYPNLR